MDGVQKSVTACGKGIRAACYSSKQTGLTAHRATSHNTEGKAPERGFRFILSGHFMLGCYSQGPIKPADVT